MNKESNSGVAVPLPWARKDIEQRMFFNGGKHTRVNSVLTAILGLLMTVLFYAALLPFRTSWFASMFVTEDYHIPLAIVFLTSWCMAILFIKSRKLAFQRRSLNYRITPDSAGFILSAGNVDVVIDRMYEIVDEPKHFTLFNRISVALSNLKNLGRVSDVGDILESQADQDDLAVDTSYSLLNGFIWAIPVLGFIGTVLGLSEAIGGFGSVLEKTDDISQIKDALKDVTGGLATAFVTTLLALVAALVVQLIATFIKKSEQEFLEACSEYCVRDVVNRLRIMPFSKSNESPA